MKGSWEPFKGPQGTLPAEIVALKRTSRELVFGLRHGWNMSDTLDIQSRCSYIKKKQTTKELKSTITKRYNKYSFVVPKQSLQEKEVELGISVSIHLLKNFDTTITGSLRTKGFVRLNSERINLGFWYDFRFK